MLRKYQYGKQAEPRARSSHLRPFSGLRKVLNLEFPLGAVKHNTAKQKPQNEQI